jgi:hypothetical protein
VIPEHDLYGRFNLLEVTKDAERVRASVDEITDEPDPICGRLEPDVVK